MNEPTTGDRLPPIRKAPLFALLALGVLAAGLPLLACPAVSAAPALGPTDGAREGFSSNLGRDARPTDGEAVAILPEDPER